ncbi:MAG: ClpX C4-type zinc finger protein [Pyrinomonadaceae bacterium]
MKYRRLRCSFCRKNETEVSKLVAGPRVYICDECVAIASRIMHSDPDDSQPPGVEAPAWRKLLDHARRFLGPDAKRVREDLLRSRVSLSSTLRSGYAD